ncbi:AAA family ATPase [Candidatus Woesearchaeota archaeon]|nr:AAA family ATPase [Candidatus Woesearchaeota archaeon]
MATIVQLHGPSGAGKSTLFEILGNNLKDYCRVDRENIKRNLKPLDKPERRRISKTACVLMMHELMEMNQNILTMEFNASNLKGKLEPTLSQKGYKFVSFYLQCPLQTCIERVMQRKPGADPQRTAECTKAVYENHRTPDQGDIVVNTADMNPQQAAEFIIRHL